MRWAISAVLVSLSMLGCRSAPVPTAFENRVFYEYGDLSARRLADFEQPYPPLDYESATPPTFIGVKVLGGTVRFSRPKNWVIRSASNEPAKRFIEYVSPTELVFAISERVEAPDESWQFILDRFRADAEKSGAKFLSEAYPNATWNAQARGFVTERFIAAPKKPFQNRCLEYLLRSKHRVILLQIVHQGESVEPVENEVLRAFTSMQVL